MRASSLRLSLLNVPANISYPRLHSPFPRAIADSVLLLVSSSLLSFMGLSLPFEVALVAVITMRPAFLQHA